MRSVIPSWMELTASPQLVPSPAPNAPSRTCTTLVGSPPWPYQTGSTPWTGVASEVASSETPFAVSTTLAVSTASSG